MPPTKVTSSGNIEDRDAARICGKNGIAAAQRQLVTLRQLRGSVDESIKELENEDHKEQFVNRAFLVARFTKATCDAFLDMASTLAEHVLPKVVGEQAKLINTTYKTATPLAGGASTLVAGGKVDYAKTLTSSAKGATSFINNDGYQMLANSTVFKAQVITAAVNGDRKEVIKTSADYLYDLHVKIAQVKQMPKMVQHAAVFADIAKQAFEYNEALGEAFDGMLESEEEGDERYVALKETLLKQARKLSTQITGLELYLQTQRSAAQQGLLP